MGDRLAFLRPITLPWASRVRLTLHRSLNTLTQFHLLQEKSVEQLMYGSIMDFGQNNIFGSIFFT